MPVVLPPDPSTIPTLTIAGVDQMPALQFGSVTVKFNTMDFLLFDPSPMPENGDAVAVTDPVWAGVVSSVETSDIDVVGHVFVKVTATNTNVAAASPAPYDLSDAPNGSTSFGYSKLKVKKTVNTDGSLTIQGSCLIYRDGFWPAMTFLLTSTNQQLAAANFSVTNVTVTWLKKDKPVYLVEFGDPIVTMQVWLNQSAQSAVLPITSTKITDGAVTTPKIATNAVTAEQIAAGAITADKLTATLVLATMIQAGAGPARMEMDGSGLRAYDASGNLVVNIPDDGSPVTVNAQILAQTLIVTGQAVLQAIDNELALGSSLQLDASQGDPSQAPSVAASFDGVTLPIDASWDIDASHYSRVGLDYDAAGGVGGATKVFWMASHGASQEFGLELLASDRSVSRALISDASAGPLLGIARLGAYVYCLSKDTSGSTGSPTNFGHTGSATYSWDWSGAATDNQVRSSSAYITPLAGSITSLSVYMGGHTAAVNTKLCIWSASGVLLGTTALFSAPMGRGLRTHALTTPVACTAGQTFFIGFWRDGTKDAEWGVASSGTFRLKYSAAASSTSGDVACSGAYACGDMQAYGSYTPNTTITTWGVRRYAQSTLVLDATYTPTFPVTPTTPQLCEDGANVYIVDKLNVGSIKWQKYNADMSTSVGVVDTGYSFTGSIYSAAAGNFDFGAARIVVGCPAVYGFQSFTAAGAVQANETFPCSGSTAMGVTFGDALGDGARFWSLPVTGGGAAVNLTKHSAWVWTSTSSIYWVAYTWCDTNATGGTHETQVGPRASITMGRRQRLTMTAPPVPGQGGTNDPNQIQFYMAPNATDPGPTALHQQSLLAIGVVTLLANAYSSGGVAGPASNTFPTGGAAAIVSQTGGFAVYGDGSLVLAGRPAFAAGDKYLIVDASGNVHKSGLGPAS